ncbi:MAG: Na+/H+ antiporter NhaA [Acidimicrobiia bacterium]|nr:Na+/H+ antiporter NhaA [Acidimicrobiia bacterium]
MAGNPPDHSPLTFMGSDRVGARVARPVLRFLHIEAASGILLIVATLLALVWANSPLKESYHELWETEIVVEVGDVFSLETHATGEAEGHTDGETTSDETTSDEASVEVVEAEAGATGHGLTLEEFVNDALMAIFFFVVGMEIKTELVTGQLRDRRAAALPAMAALGGMVVPAALYVGLNVGGAVEGWGIPMATDIAFAVGVVSLLGDRVPGSLKVFLLTLAIVDDIGAILVIALFYTEQVSLGWLGLGLALLLGMLLMQKLRVWYVPAYVLVGIFVWYAVFKSGVHATIAGVAMGLLTPAVPLRREPIESEWAEALLGEDRLGASSMRRAQFDLRETVSVAERLIESLHPYTSYLIIPIFALANAGIELSSDSLEAAASSRVTWGVIVGLVVGKLLGVSLFTWIATATGLSVLPRGVRFAHIVGIAAVAGIGFTVSLFITGLAFQDPILQDEAKIGILAASFLAALLGLVLLSRVRAEPALLEPGLEQSADF